MAQDADSTQPQSSPGGAGTLRALLAVAAGVALALVGIWSAIHGTGDFAAPTLPLLLAAIAGAALAAYWLAQLRGLRQLQQRELASHAGMRALHEARAEARALAELVDAWQWRCDVRHHLTRLRAPAGDAGPRPWPFDAASNAVAMPLWQPFDAADPGTATLRERLSAQAPLGELQLDEPGGSRWLLRGVPCFDAQGIYCGHLGSARRVEQQGASDADPVSLALLLEALPGPAWIGWADARGASYRLRRLNEAAMRISGSTEDDWDALRHSLPAEVRQALEHGETMTPNWQVRTREIPNGAAVLLLLPREIDASAARGAEQEAFSYTVSHDLRAPLRVVEGFTRILKEDYGRALDRVGNDHLERVLGAAARMNSMIDALLGLAQLSTRPLAQHPVNLSQLASYVIDELRRQHPERDVDVQVQAGMVADGDPTLLRLVLENLLGNAWKYSAKCDKAEISFDCTTQEGRRVYAVHDNGAGFDMRYADRLFGVFQRLHSATEFSGTGVGLASVRRIVQRHGGDIWAHSEPGGGAHFYFTLGR